VDYRKKVRSLPDWELLTGVEYVIGWPQPVTNIFFNTADVDGRAVGLGSFASTPRGMYIAGHILIFHVIE
jgi:hypothetical protein